MMPIGRRPEPPGAHPGDVLRLARPSAPPAALLALPTAHEADFGDEAIREHAREALLRRAVRNLPAAPTGADLIRVETVWAQGHPTISPGAERALLREFPSDAAQRANDEFERYRRYALACGEWETRHLRPLPPIIRGAIAKYYRV